MTTNCVNVRTRVGHPLNQEVKDCECALLIFPLLRLVASTTVCLPEGPSMNMELLRIPGILTFVIRYSQSESVRLNQKISFTGMMGRGGSALFNHWFHLQAGSSFQPRLPSEECLERRMPSLRGGAREMMDGRVVA
ncbi:hypothetical protein CEXT_165381 [Caerostris extrusa]|uniref:Uncharacterized protein n=1 Tax=Caerostris extrusa TaxID=172846 RepID=A0AAV4T5F1_CAEEX|nr:hypothetical protein CEXT_165381 [Caerostris extrusa]